MSHEEIHVEERSVAREGAESVAAEVEMGMGEVRVTGGAEELLQARFAYEREDWRPEVSYAVAEGRGKLRVKQPHLRGNFPRGVTYNWDLGFDNAVPLDLSLRLGAGKATLLLGQTMLARLSTQIGAGNLTADLCGDLERLEEISVDTGSGQTGLVLSGTYRRLEKVKLSTASGTTDLALGGHYPQLKQLLVNMAGGQINLGMSGDYAALRKVHLHTVSGEIGLHLGGGIQQDLEVEVNNVAGTVNVHYPEGIGVAVHYHALSGKVEAPGFTRQGGRYVNAAFGETEVTLQVRVSGLSGKVRMQLSEG